MEDRTARPALLLAWVAGSVDGLGYLVLFHLFTANMTGNSVTIGTHLGEAYWVPALRSAFTIPIFLAGVALGAVLRTAVTRRGRSPRPAVLGLEAFLLVGFLLEGVEQVRAGGILPDSGAFYRLAAMATFAMGLQNAVPPLVRGFTVRTTYVTGTLTSVAEAVVGWLVTRAGPPRRTARFQVLLWTGVWAAYVLGAATSGLAERYWGPIAVVLPLIGLCAMITRDLTRRPAAA